MVDIGSIPDFPARPGQHPGPNDPLGVTPVQVMLITAPLDADGVSTPLNAAAVDAFIIDELAAGRAYTTGVDRWSPWSTLQLPLSFATAQRYNYARFILADGSSWYAFLTANYLNLTTTAYEVEADDCATYPYSIGYCNVLRGHVAVAASQGDAYGDQYMTAPEPVDAPPARAVLSEGILADTDMRVVVVSANDLRGSDSVKYFNHHVMETEIANAANEATQATVKSGGGVQIGVPESPYPWRVGTGGSMQIFVPNVTPSPVSTIDGIAVGGGVFVFSVDGFAGYMSIMQGAPWITDGISEISLVPAWSVGGIGGGGSHAGAGIFPTSPLDPLWTTAAAMPLFVSELITATTTASALAGWRGTVAGALGVGVYRKALTSQFTRIVVSDGESEHEFKPEVWKTPGVGFTVVSEATHLSPVTRAIPVGYTALGDQQGITFAKGGTPARTAAGYGIANSNTAQADVGPKMNSYTASTTRQVLLDQKALAIVLAATSARLAVGIQGIQTILGSAGSAAASPIQQGLGAVTGLGSLATSAIQANASLDILDISKAGSFDIATYQLGLGGIQSWYAFRAWEQAQHAITGRGGAHALQGAWRAILGRGLAVMITAPTSDAVSRLLATWQRYGYMIGRAMVPPRLDAMDAFTYWQLEEPVILGPAPAAAKERIAARFSRGTTVWTSVAAIGTQPANNPRAGVTY